MVDHSEPAERFRFVLHPALVLIRWTTEVWSQMAEHRTHKAPARIITSTNRMMWRYSGISGTMRALKGDHRAHNRHGTLLGQSLQNHVSPLANHCFFLILDVIPISGGYTIPLSHVKLCHTMWNHTKIIKNLCETTFRSFSLHWN